MIYDDLKKGVVHFLAAGYCKARSILIPNCCAHCKQLIHERTIFCDHCFCMIKPIVSKPIQLNQKYTMPVLAISDYEDPLRPLILAKNWSNIIASKQLAELIIQFTHFKYIPIDYLIPVPTHWTRFAWRGYNQTEEIAKTLGNYRNIPVVNLVQRTKKTKFQAQLSAHERKENVSDAFVLTTKNLDSYRGKHLVIIDDLMTTGSTLIATAKALLKAEPSTITALVACRVCGK
jgi:ComF family protein